MKRRLGTTTWAANLWLLLLTLLLSTALFAPSRPALADDQPATAVQAADDASTATAEADEADDEQSTATLESADLARLFSGEAPQSLDELKALQDRVRSLVEKLTPCTVNVQVGGAQGSGVIVSADGYVLTAAHVVGEPGRNVRFTFPDGTTARGKTLGVNREVDAGLMKINGEGTLPFAEIGESTELKRGQWCLCLGHPGGYQRGRNPVARLGRVLSSRSGVLVTDCALIGGDSGGPLFDLEGKVVGIHSRISAPLTSNMHVPSSQYTAAWDRLVKGDDWGASGGDPTPYLGVQGDPDANEARIVEVQPDTPAERAGLKPGDVVTHVDGEALADFASLAAYVVRKEPGDKVVLKVTRDGQTLELEAIIGLRGP
jgi:serine protease Do